MTAKPVVPREQACSDIEAATDYYAFHVGEDVALRFVDELERAYRLIAARPATGSPLYGHELGLPGLRHRRLKRFPYLIFYIEHDDHVDVWRVLHAQRDIPVRIGEPHG
jgi:toxin ParE1/3/4